ncbi:type IV pilus secretin PilQ [Pistricoccus aurantiacus]|uniref:Type IV pilus secretin PilQ n=2 Tax=Pistricoccus aurantiacus TaxID=1883414 RepID=A0A5B8SNU7_9GAMM|nr:type IV pilus secretin PilQ [Pistricoccus aurantiacus]
MQFKTGKLISRLAISLLLLVPSLALAESTLTDLEARPGGDGGTELVLSFSGGVPQVNGYRLEDPPRLTFDLMKTAVGIEQRRWELGLDRVETLNVLEAGERTRLVLDLTGPLPYTTRAQGEQLYITLGSADASSVETLTQANEPLPQPVFPASAYASQPTIESFDFRRGEGGAGRLIVYFDQDDVDVRVRRSGRQILATLQDVTLPPDQDQVLDVSDFATPITRITPTRGNNGIELAIQTSGDYTLNSTQLDRRLIIEAEPVKPRVSKVKEQEEFPFTGKRMTLNFQNIDVRAVLSLISEVSGLNVVASDSVTGQVTLNLQNVPWDQALDLVLKSHGLASRRQGNVIVVAPVEELASIDRQKIESREQMEELAPLTTEYLQVKYAKAEDLAALLRGADGFGLLTERGRVSVDRRTNTLLIQDTAEQIVQILATIERLDIAVRQVQIEARIVVARDGVTRQLGVDWGLSGGGNGKLDLSGASNGTAPNGGLSVDLGSAAGASSSFSFGYLSGDILLDLELNALETENKSHTISQPRVITANQRKAVIKQGTEIPYQESTSSGATNVEFKEAVLSLEVTPQITPDNRIIMDLAINNDTVSDQSFGGAPAIDTNEIQTQVLVNNGETVVLGGILTTEQLRNLSKTPFLGDIPVLGNLFRYTQEENEKVELLVFITPRILEDGLAIR